MEKKYRVLRIVATIWKVLAWIVLVLSVLGGCSTLAFGLLGGAAARGNSALALGGGLIGGAITAVVAIFFGLLYFLFLYAFSELVDVLIALEENTRATAEQLKNISKA